MVKNKPLFIAPVDIKEGDDITLFFGKPILIMRDGREVWRSETMPSFFIDQLSTDNKKVTPSTRK